jgi:predicted metal-dependent HD superfamily phosphohydrolase
VNLATPERWSRLWQAAIGKDAPLEYYRQLVEMYSEPHRHYHNLCHISDCLDWFDRFASLAREPLVIELAIWFHDAIYDTRAANNEERSAELACDWLGKVGAEPVMLDSVARLVMATKSHDSSKHPDAPLLVDVDLSILGQPEARFWEYENQIRQEYGWVPADVFCAKRSEILKGFLSRKRLYQTGAFFQKLETQARDNLTASIHRLMKS